MAKLSFKGVEPMTKQQFRDGTKVDQILKKYATLGVDPNNVGLFQRNVAQMAYGTADLVQDYQVQLNRINMVKAYFASLPSGIRDKFANDPKRMLDFMADPKNLEACAEMGLFAKAEKEEAAAATAPPPAPAPEKSAK